MFQIAAPLLVLVVMLASAAPAAADPRTDAIVLPGATSAEGIAAGRGSTFFAGDLFAGDIFRGDVRRGTAELFVDVPNGSRGAVGMAVDVRNDLLFVAGGFNGQGYVYDARNGTDVAVYQFADPGIGATVVNDVVVTREGAWFTDSAHPRLYFVPIVKGSVAAAFETLELTGPAANVGFQFNLNGIQATANGKTLIVAHSGTGELYTVDPETGSTALIAGVSVPNVDGIVLSGRTLWAVQNSNQVNQIQLAGDLSAGTVEEIITNGRFQTPTTAARFGDTLAVVNAKFDTGFPPTATQYEVIVIPA